MSDTHPLREAVHHRRLSDYLALALMYFAQGLPMGLAFEALPTLIRHSGHGMAQIGWVGLALLPWALKFLWASHIDNLCRKAGISRVVFVTQALVAIACLGMSTLDFRTDLALILMGVVGLNLICRHAGHRHQRLCRQPATGKRSWPHQCHASRRIHHGDARWRRGVAYRPPLFRLERPDAGVRCPDAGALSTVVATP